MIFSAFLETILILFLMEKTINIGTIKYSSNPLLYTTSNKLQREKVSVLIEEFGEELRNISGKCMDIGCGPGDITKDIILPALGPKAMIIGTDILKHMIYYAEKMYGAKGRLKFEVLDIQTKNLPTKYVSEFDFIFSSHTLHWCNDIEQAFKNIYRMLRPNGTMLILFVSSHKIFDVLKNVTQDIRFASHVIDMNISPFQNSIHPRKELQKLLQKIGFTIKHCSFRDSYDLEKNTDQFFNSIVSFLDFIDDIPCDQKEEFKKEFKDRYLETQFICQQENNKKKVILNAYNVLVTFAQKRIL